MSLDLDPATRSPASGCPAQAMRAGRAARPETTAAATPDLTCHLYPGWRPHIRPAPPQRPWMDATPEAFAYRCLPLDIANAHGWEILSPITFEARWRGGAGVEDVEIRLPEGAPAHLVPVSLFGQGVVTFHIQGLFRTSPGWNLWVGGSPNRPKDGVWPLSGIIETDWAPFTFTMNWRFTRPDHWVRFEEGEPICFFFPVQRGALEQVTPRFASIEDDPQLKSDFEEWSRLRDAFHARTTAEPPAKSSDKWQKHYYRGVDLQGRARIEDHQSKLRLAPFSPAIAPDRCAAPLEPAAAPAATAGEARALAKRDWLLEVMEAHRQLAPGLADLDTYEGMTRERFLAEHYAAGRPVVLAGEMAAWPALERWTPDYLARKVGSALVEYQGDRDPAGAYERLKQQHLRTAPFDAFIRMIQERPGNGAYMTAYNSHRNREALRPLQTDLGRLDKYLSSGSPDAEGMMWIGPAGAFTPLHHDLTDNFIAQVVGRKEVLLCPAAEVGKLYNDRHVFSEICDLRGPIAAERQARLADLRVYAVTLEPGDILFVPIGWWHQVTALDFSVTLTYTNFIWRNDWAQTYPAD